jgi:uncharacterized membrane protein YkvA (DUF1232 family)
MADKPRGLSLNLNFLQSISKRVKLIARLMIDSRVNPLIKLLPVGTLVYLVVPTDLMPLLPFDDAAVLWLGSYLFVELCPPEIVQEHMRAIELAATVSQAGPADAAPQTDVIDAEFHEVGPN